MLGCLNYQTSLFVLYGQVWRRNSNFNRNFVAHYE